MALDVFFQLYRKSRLIPGESPDPLFRKAMELMQFSLDTEVNLKQSIRVMEKQQLKRDDDQLVDVRGLFEERPQTLMEQEEVKDPPEDEEVESIDHMYFEIQKEVDSASPHLFQNYCQVAADKAKDNLFERAVVSLRKPGADGFIYLKMEFMNVYVVNYSISLPSTNIPTETVKFCCASYTMEYVAQAATGGADASSRRTLGWDFHTVAKT